jgi:diguanylate cyclase (GGDEF)-like protein/PAS domain S-box-containing protein
MYLGGFSVKTNVFLREEQQFKEVSISNQSKPEIDNKFLNKWQNIVNTAADIIDVPAVLIMKINEQKIEVLLKNENKDNPYKAGDSESLGRGLYCETVIGRNNELLIENALSEEAWNDNPDIDFNMISYYGLPINWPDSESFGTLCILDNKSLYLKEKHKNLMREFKTLIEDDLELLFIQDNLNNQKTRLDLIIEGTNAGTWEWNIQTGETVFNDRWAEMLGYSLEEISPTTIETWQNLIHPLDLERALNKTQKHFDGEIDEYDTEIRMKHKDGRWIWMNDRGRIVNWTENNQPLKMVGIHLDITERKKREKELQFLAKAMTNISDSVMLTDKYFKIQYINKASERLFGYTLKELKGKTPEIFNAEDLSNEIQQEIYDKISNGEIYEAEILNKRKDGSTFICEFKITPIEDSEGEVYAYTGIQRDITDRKRQEEKLEFQLKFQKTLAQISANLLEINSANIDRKINISLKEVGVFFDVDRSYIFQFADKTRTMTNTHEWCNNGIKSEKENLQDLLSDNFTWLMEQLSRNEYIYIKDVNKLGKKAEAEQKIFMRQGIKSATLMPMVIENELFGFFGFDSVENHKEYSKEEIRLLKIFTDIITNAFSKYKGDQRIRDLTYKDSLTGLYNRRFFEEELERLDTKRQLPISIIIADINGLKIINDSLGHKKGDDLLAKAAGILKEEIRQEDILARQGGDEFALLLPHTNRSGAEKIIKRIRNRAKKTKNDHLTVSIALGVSTKEESSQDIYEVLRKADNNMYNNKLSESRSIKSNLVKGMLTTLETKSNERREHTAKMKKLAKAFSEKLDLSNSELNRLLLLTDLHDIGKITIPEEILKKPTELTAEELKIIKKHPEKGYKIANSSEEFAVVSEEIYSHHENWDGSGYPRQLKGKDIPYLARIVAIIDAYDLMISGSLSKNPMNKEQAIKELKKCSDIQFDPELVQEFIEFLQTDE